MTIQMTPAGHRLKAIREGSRLRQEDFVARLNTVSTQLFGDDGPHYNASKVSKLETGAQRVSLDDVAVYAVLDPLGRGKLWAGWGESLDSALRKPRQGPSVIQEPPADIYDQPITPAKKPTRKRA